MPRVMALRTIQQQSSKSSVVGRNNETNNYFSSAMSSGGRCGGGTCPSSTYVILWYLCGLCLTFCNRLSPAIIYFPPGYGNINLISLNLSYYFPIALTLYRHQSQLTTIPKWSETPVTPQQLRPLQDSRALLSSVSSSYNALKTSILIRRIQDADPYGSNGNWFTAQDNLLVVNVFSFLFH